MSSTFLNHLPPLLKEDECEQGSIAVPSSLVIAPIQHDSNHQLLKTQIGFLHHMLTLIKPKKLSPLLNLISNNGHKIWDLNSSPQGCYLLSHDISNRIEWRGITVYFTILLVKSGSLHTAWTSSVRNLWVKVESSIQVSWPCAKANSPV